MLDVDLNQNIQKLTYRKMTYFQFDLFLGQIKNKHDCVISFMFVLVVRKVTYFS